MDNLKQQGAALVLFFLRGNGFERVNRRIVEEESQTARKQRAWKSARLGMQIGALWLGNRRGVEVRRARKAKQHSAARNGHRRIVVFA